MPLTMINTEGGSFTPELRCDHCAKPIDRPDQGNLVWRSYHGAGRPSIVHAVHKDCTWAFEQRLPDAAFASDEAANLPDLVRRALGLPPTVLPVFTVDDFRDVHRPTGFPLDGQGEKQGDSH